jgi:hypothetical protein
MPSRIEVELTSRRDDGSWTWRAAGARQPKGEVDGAVVPAEASVGDVLRAEAEVGVDGIAILALAPVHTRQRREPERIEIVGTRRDEPDVVTTLVEKRGRRDRDERGGRGGGPRGGGRRDGRDRPGRDGRPGEGRGRGDGPRARGERPARAPKPPERPKAKRLRPGRAHRNAVLRAVDADQRPLAELVLRDGLPGVRQTIDRMNAAAREHGQPNVAADPVLDLAEKLVPHLRMAEWRDRADAALADVDELDLRDLRQVVVAADANARDDETRALGEQLRAALVRRVDEEHAAWLAELTELVDEGRLVRALRLSSRPPKAGFPLPAELATRLADAATAALGPDTGSDRYATVVDALAFSPVHARVAPAAVPSSPGDSLTAVIRKLADRVPLVAAAFGIEPAPAGKGRGRSRGRGGRKAPAAKAGAPVPAPPVVPGGDAPPPAGPDAAAPAASAPDAPVAPGPGEPTEAASSDAPEASAPAAPAPEAATPAVAEPAQAPAPEEPTASDPGEPAPAPGPAEPVPAPVEPAPAPHEPTPSPVPVEPTPVDGPTD